VTPLRLEKTRVPEKKSKIQRGDQTLFHQELRSGWSSLVQSFLPLCGGGERVRYIGRIWYVVCSTHFISFTSLCV